MTRHLIESDNDIAELIRHLLPAHALMSADCEDTLRQIRHPADVLMTTLWYSGHCTPMGINKVCSTIIDRHAWDDVPPKTHPSEDHRKRLLKEVQRFNKKLIDVSCSYHVFINYERSQGKLQLIIDPVRVAELSRQAEARSRSRRQTKDINIQLLTECFNKGVPVLEVGDVIRCHLKAPIAGYPHLFHIDANHAVDKLFPAKGSKRQTVRCGETISFPNDLLKDGFWWRVGETPGKNSGYQQLVAVISRLDVKISAAHLQHFGLEIKMRGALQEEPAFEDLAAGTMAFGLVRYEWRRSSQRGE